MPISNQVQYKNNKFDKANSYLDTIKKIYINPKDIIGHLKILIEIYKTINKLKQLN